MPSSSAERSLARRLVGALVGGREVGVLVGGREVGPVVVVTPPVQVTPLTVKLVGTGLEPLQVPLKPNEVVARSEEHTSELQSRQYLVCRLLLEKKNQASPLRSPWRANPGSPR